MARNYSHILLKHSQEHQGTECCGWEENNKSSLLKKVFLRSYSLLRTNPAEHNRSITHSGCSGREDPAKPKLFLMSNYHPSVRQCENAREGFRKAQPNRFQHSLVLPRDGRVNIMQPRRFPGEAALWTNEVFYVEWSACDSLFHWLDLPVLTNCHE